MLCRICDGLSELWQYSTPSLRELQQDCQRCLSVEDNAEIERIIKRREDDQC